MQTENKEKVERGKFICTTLETMQAQSKMG